MLLLRHISLLIQLKLSLASLTISKAVDIKYVTVNCQTKKLVGLEKQARRLNQNLVASKLQASVKMSQRVDQRNHHKP
ncbi:MAG: hypothetical protein KPI85_06600 [cyanobacterium endosymbiont of Epithemia adnata isolate EadnSB Bon19]